MDFDNKHWRGRKIHNQSLPIHYNFQETNWGLMSFSFNEVGSVSGEISKYVWKLTSSEKETIFMDIFICGIVRNDSSHSHIITENYHFLFINYNQMLNFRNALKFWHLRSTTVNKRKSWTVGRKNVGKLPVSSQIFELLSAG